MDLLYIAVFTVGALLYGWLLPMRWRQWALLVASVLLVYRLQPPLFVRYLDFVLPTTTLLLCLVVWWLVRSSDTRRDDLITLVTIIGLVLGLSLTRYLVPELRPLPSRPPDVWWVALALFGVLGVSYGLWRGLRTSKHLLTMGIVLIATLFVILKTEPLATGVSAALRGFNGQDVTLASAADLSWLGFSYVAFRLIHVLRETQIGKLPALSLREYLTYVIFFPTLTAGPIERAERFAKDWRALHVEPLATAPRFVEGGGRIAVGLFKKFVVGDSLALFALNATNAEQAISTGALWFLLYAYALRLFFDFSGYSDIAIGIALLLGIQLPENFDRPYLKQNIAAFWQSWHITLSNWVRFYVFSPLSRALLVRKANPILSVLVAQVVTMAIIGLWHGVTWNFLIWGIWHAVGLFIHKLWSDRTRRWYLALNQRPHLKRVWMLTGVMITFHFVVLGWVWFALPSTALAWRVWLRLLGLA